MKERLRFRRISKITLSEETEISLNRATKSFQESTKKDTIEEYPLYDILLESAEHISPSLISQRLNTEVNQIEPKQTPIVLYDPSLGKMEIQEDVVTTTDIKSVSIHYEAPIIADINLNRRQVPTLRYMDTQMPENVQEEAVREIHVEPVDVSLENISLAETPMLNTDVLINEVELGMGALGFVEQNLPIFEELIESDGKFPRSFGESLNTPFILLIGEDEYEWHIPIIYALKELFREITDKHPRVTFREPELLEEVEERVDSTEPHSLEQFSFEHRIEFLDVRRMRLAVDEFAKIVKGRLESAFLQQFGILVVAVKRRDLEKARRAIDVKGIQTYVCSPNDLNSRQVCSKVLGINPLDDFFSGLESCRRFLDQTLRKFSIFVKRGEGATDKFQYPLKVATFVYLLNEIRKRRKAVIESYEELCKFIKDVMDKEKIIKVEEPFNEENTIIPDLVYSPEGENEATYIEIETLVGTLEPMKKIDESVEKYKNLGQAKNIWIVLRPISALLHYEELKVRERAYKILYEDKKIKFKVLTLKISKGKPEWELVSLDSFLKGVDHVKRVQKEG